GDRDADLLSQARVAIRDDEAHEIIHLLVDRALGLVRLRLERDDVVRGAEIVREQEAGARDGAIGGDCPAQEVRSPALLHEPEEVPTKAIDGSWLEDRLDRLRDRDNELLHRRAQRQAWVTDRERREEDVLEAPRRRNEHLDEVLLAVVRQVAPRDEGELR